MTFPSGATLRAKRSAPVHLLAGALLAAALAACGGNPASRQTVAYPIDDQASEKNLIIPLPPSDAPVPEAGKSSLSGALYSYTIERLIPDTMAYLTPADGANHDTMPPFLAGPDPSRGDFVFRSDGIGNISIADVPPGSYFLVVSAPYNWSIAESSAMDPTPLLIRLNTGDRLALGTVYFSWP
jgi:hypothetical protein